MSITMLKSWGSNWSNIAYRKRGSMMNKRILLFPSIFPYSNIHAHTHADAYERVMILSRSEEDRARARHVVGRFDSITKVRGWLLWLLRCNVGQTHRVFRAMRQFASGYVATRCSTPACRPCRRFWRTLNAPAVPPSFRQWYTRGCDLRGE